MAVVLLALFICVPLIEIAVFIQVGEEIGVFSTIAATVLTAMAGVWLLRAQGLATLARARSQLDQGVMPARELFDGLCLLLAGALLLIPGFVSDAIGLLLFVPASRNLLHAFLAEHVEATAEARVFVDRGGPRSGPGTRRRGTGPVIDGEYRDISEDPDERKKESKESSDDSDDQSSARRLP